MTSSTSKFCDTCGVANRPQAWFCIACGNSLQVVKTTAHYSLTGRLLANVLLKHRYRIIATLGRGGMGTVYKAEDTLLGNRQVALKEMSQSGLSLQEQKEATDSFKQEAIILARLQHPNLPSIIDHFEDNGRWYLVMSFIEGETLEDYLSHAQSGKLPSDEVVQIGMQLCTVLDYLHTQQLPIIFRDLKPSNVMRTSDGHLYLIDFGIARHFKPGKAKDTATFGTPGFASPEQYGPAQTTPKSDIYSLGVTLHYLLSGNDPSVSPFRFAPLSDVDIPIGLQKLIMQMVELDSDKRPASMASVRQKLQQLLSVSNTQSFSPSLSPNPPASPPASTQRRHDVLEAARQLTQQLTDWLNPKTSLVPPNDQKNPNTASSPRNFFISYHKADRAWAEWIAWQLEDAGYTAILPDWDFRPGLLFEQEMQRAAKTSECTIIILSSHYLNTRNTRDATWTTALRKGTVYGQRTLLPVCVGEYGTKLQHLLGSIVSIDLIGQDESVAREKLLAGIRSERWKPTTTPNFPGKQASHSSSEQPPFPASSDASKQTHPQSITTATLKPDSPATLTFAPLESIEVFFSYSHVDTELRGELEKYLSNLKRQRTITGWHDGEIGAGNEWASEIEIHLSQANIILLLVSQDFIASDYCFEIEMKKALERHDRREACVIPIILRPAHWKETPFGKLQALPTGGMPITMWSNRDAAFLDVAQGIQSAVNKLTRRI